MSAAVNVKDYTKRIGNNDYIMVSGRVLLAHEDNPDALSIRTELIQDNEDYVTMKATVTTRKGEFDGHATSYKRTGSNFEKKTPLEVAETSAVGRALGLAGYAIENGIASADEMHKADDYGNNEPTAQPRNNVTPMPQRERDDPRKEIVGQIGAILAELNIEEDSQRKLIRALGPEGKEPKAYTLMEWSGILTQVSKARTADEALGLAVKVAKARSQDTSSDLFEPEEVEPEPKERQRQEDAENAKTYIGTKPLMGQITEKQIKAAFAIGRVNGKDPEQVKALVKELFGVDHIDQISKQDASELIDALKGA